MNAGGIMWGTSRSTTVALAVAASLTLIVACGGDDGEAVDGAEPPEVPPMEGGTAPASEPHYGGHVSDLYADDTNWICKPGTDDDVCARDLDATAVLADGTTEPRPHEPAEDPPIDCFYIYPTVSADETPNSDLDLGRAEEIAAVLNQAARLTASCRVFAPAYRQVTLSMIGGGDDVPDDVDPGEVAYEDVTDAFRHYVDNESQGRGFVLVGHSQGAGHLRQLIIDEIDDDPALRDQFVSALLLGTSVAVPEGEVLGGDFDNVPACEATDQTGCVVSYASFRAGQPPPDDALFGRPREGDGVALCVNPASPAGGSAFVQPYFRVDPPEGSLLGAGGGDREDAGSGDTAQVTTPFVTYPDFVEAECVRDGEFSYLALTVHGDPDDPRIDDIGGDITPQWGMHLVDVNVAMGDLVDLVEEQAAAYTG